MDFVKWCFFIKNPDGYPVRFFPIDIFTDGKISAKITISLSNLYKNGGEKGFEENSIMIRKVVMKFVTQPIKKLISEAERIGKGDYGHKIEMDREDEIGQLAVAIDVMRSQIREKQEELNKQKEEYQNLFEHVPCYITVQDRNFKLLSYNQEFAEKFKPKPGDYCYVAYKGRSKRCEICPVVETFEDAQSHSSEETGVNKDHSRSFWMVRTSPIKNKDGEVIAAMEMSLDVTKMKFLEKEVRESEEHYRVIFDTIPNPLFVLDAKTLEILDCNNSMTAVYGFEKDEIKKTSFLRFFEDGDRNQFARELKTTKALNKIRQIRKDGKAIFVNIHTAPSEYMEHEALLVTATDVTERLIVEQQLIQASKLATLGEMATGVAHELNQPLSVIKTASSFFLKKVRNKEAVTPEIMETLAEEMDSHVDRASKIINHMREFGRQADVKRIDTQVNDVLTKALEIFSQQLKLRQIEVVQELSEDLPAVLADSNRLEQVFINLLTNARDAIEEKNAHFASESEVKRIIIRTGTKDGSLFIEIKDTGIGIPESILDRIFDPFFTTKKAGKGTGLGLSISYGIVRDYDGTIRVKSEEGVGSTFYIYFPISGEG